MTKRKEVFEIEIDNSMTQFQNKKEVVRTDITVQQALNTVLRQMSAGGYRERTLYDYDKIVTYFMRDTEVVYLADISNEVIYKWLENMKVKNSTKLTRLKSLKAFLGRCLDNGWFENRFWRTVNIKVDAVVKQGATEEDVNLVLSLLDLTNFLDLRNATAILLMYRCGLRIGTLTRMTENQIDFESQKIILSGEVMKNHKSLILPFDKQLGYFLEVLINQNKKVRKEYNVKNNLLFITMKGTSTAKSLTSNSIQRGLRKYTNEFGVKNINPHALRRGFAKNLYMKSKDIVLVSKALGHNDLSVTTQYLHTELTDIADKLREYL